MIHLGSFWKIVFSQLPRANEILRKCKTFHLLLWIFLICLDTEMSSSHMISPAWFLTLHLSSLQVLSIKYFDEVMYGVWLSCGCTGKACTHIDQFKNSTPTTLVTTCGCLSSQVPVCFGGVKWLLTKCFLYSWLFDK